MSYKPTHRELQNGNIVDAKTFDQAYDHLKGELNGNLNQQNLPAGSIAPEALSQGSLYSFHYTSSLEEVALATSSTKDALRMVFNSINSKGSYKQNDPAMENVGGMTGLMNAMNNEFGVLEMPASPSSWNYNASTAWGKTIKGLGFEAVAKATADAVKKLYKTTVEKI